tara:strand:+ start:193 stop:468 length:276 start_codon:yes stop_codon:yes gene_type:complete
LCSAWQQGDKNVIQYSSGISKPIKWIHANLPLLRINIISCIPFGFFFAHSFCASRLRIFLFLGFKLNEQSKDASAAGNALYISTQQQCAKP